MPIQQFIRYHGDNVVAMVLVYAEGGHHLEKHHARFVAARVAISG